MQKFKLKSKSMNSLTNVSLPVPQTIILLHRQSGGQAQRKMYHFTNHPMTGQPPKGVTSVN